MCFKNSNSQTLQKLKTTKNCIQKNIKVIYIVFVKFTVNKINLSHLNYKTRNLSQKTNFENNLVL